MYAEEAKRLQRLHQRVHTRSPASAGSPGPAPSAQTVTACQEREDPAREVRAVVLASWVKRAYARQLAGELAAGFPNSIIGPARQSPRVREAPAANLLARLGAQEPDHF
jgi:hypothetical protein